MAARIVAQLAGEILALKGRIESIDEEIGERFFARPEARILISLPGIGPILGAEFLVAVGDVYAPSLVPIGSPPMRVSRPGRPRLRQAAGQPPQNERRKQDLKAGLLPVSVCQPAQRSGVQSLLRAQES